MVKEIFEPNRETTVYSEPLIDLKLLRKKSNARTFPGWLIMEIKRNAKEGKLDMVKMLEFIYQKHKELERDKNAPLIQLSIIDGWKGKDYLNIYKGFENDFLIETHNKDKETGEITTSRHTIPRGNVNRILFFINKWKIGESHKCYDFAEVLGEKDWKEVWKKRMEVYFPCYYFPIKILEKLKIIKYSGRGEITKIR